MSRRTLITDTFVRANSTTLGANWSSFPGADSMQVFNNAARPDVANAANDNLARYSALTPPKDQWAQGTITTVTSSDGASFLYAGCRFSSNGDGYVAAVSITSSTPRLQIVSYSSAVAQGVDTATTFANGLWNLGDTFSLEAVGTKLTAFINATPQLTLTPGTFLFTSGSVMIGGYNVSSSDSVIGTFTAGDFVSGLVPQLLMTGFGV
jgi:hypothetical protein